jgi:hypothetical protein
LAAVIEYADAKAGKEMDHVMEWSTFVSKRWRERKTSRVMLRAVEAALGGTKGSLKHNGIGGETWEAVIQNAADQHNAYLARLREVYDAATPRDEVVGWRRSDCETWVRDTTVVEGWIDDEKGRRYQQARNREPIETDRLIRQPIHDAPCRGYLMCFAVDEGLPCCCGDWVEMPPPPVVLDAAAVLARAYELLAASPLPAAKAVVYVPPAELEEI